MSQPRRSKLLLRKIGITVAVLAAAIGVWLFKAGWPDLIVASGLLLMFLRSAWRVFHAALAAQRGRDE